MTPRPAPAVPTWLAAELPFRRYLLDVGGRSVHVMEAGVGRPVLMVHGNPTWGYLYRKVAAALDPTRFRVVLPDLVGLGLSDKPRSLAEHTLENHVGWLARTIDALDLRDAIVVGQDWGGPIGFGAIATQPERASGLVILNTVIGPPKPGFKPTAFHRFARMPLLSDAVFRGLGMPPRGMRLAQGDKASIRGRTARAYWYPLRRLRDRMAPLALARMVPDSDSHPSVAALAACHTFVAGFDGPVGIVWGQRDPILGRVLSHVERTCPDAVVVTRTQAGHSLQEEVPDAIAAAIRAVAKA